MDEESLSVKNLNSNTHLHFKIGIIGAGKVGLVLASLLRECGNEITAVYTNNDNNIERVNAILNGVEICSIEEVIEKSEIVFFTIPDDALYPTCLLYTSPSPRD